MHERHGTQTTGALVIWALLGAAPGCGSSGSASGDMSVADQGGASFAMACASWASAYCGTLQRCAPFQLTTQFAGVADCAARYRLVCLPTTTLPATGVSVGGLSACAAAVSGATCTDFLSGPNFVPAACRFPGTLAAGQSCGNDSQCSSGSCTPMMSNSCGQCLTRMADGSACMGDGDCAYGSVCVGPAQARQCARAAQLGDACSAISPCQAGLYCSGGQCAAKLGIGAACTATGGECDGARGFYCDLGTGRCAASATAPIGGACGQVGNQNVACAGGAGCFGPTASRVCVAPAPDGAACNSDPMSTGPGCLANATCRSTKPPMGTCAVFDPSLCK
jgi:hypothetical protein